MRTIGLGAAPAPARAGAVLRTRLPSNDLPSLEPYSNGGVPVHAKHTESVPPPPNQAASKTFFPLTAASHTRRHPGGPAANGRRGGARPRPRPRRLPGSCTRRPPHGSAGPPAPIRTATAASGPPRTSSDTHPRCSRPSGPRRPHSAAAHPAETRPRRAPSRGTRGARSPRPPGAPVRRRVPGQRGLRLSRGAPGRAPRKPLPRPSPRTPSSGTGERGRSGAQPGHPPPHAAGRKPFDRPTQAPSPHNYSTESHFQNPQQSTNLSYF